MTEYWLIFGLAIFLQIIPIPSKNINNLKLIIPFLLIFFYSSIRVGGFDYEPYELAFNDIKQNFRKPDFEIRMEIGYVLLNYIMPSYRYLIVFLSAFTCITYYWLFKTFVPSKYYVLAFVLFAIGGDKMLLFQISGLRNAIAINIFALSIPLIFKRKLIAYIFFTVLAYTFHNSAIFFMPIAYIVANPTAIKSKELIYWGVIMLFFLVSSSNFLSEYITSFINSYFDRYNFYTEFIEENSSSRSLAMYSFLIIIIILTFLIVGSTTFSPKENIIIKLSFFYLISLLLGVLNFRMSQYFAPYLMICTIIFMIRTKDHFLKYAYLGVICFYFWYSFFIVYSADPLVKSFEYVTIFDK